MAAACASWFEGPTTKVSKRNSGRRSCFERGRISLERRASDRWSLCGVSAREAVPRWEGISVGASEPAESRVVVAMRLAPFCGRRQEMDADSESWLDEVLRGEGV